ncbi:hypothetical protein GGS24DRAFT_182436 [Hypoxylon argillaceum]|nr:hypothetical protein GGS24DRAFT_182436 [Hypoxylon argillaceum]
MDPVSAVRVAAAAFQFFDVAIKAYNTFQEIQKSAKSATEENKQLEDNIRLAQSLRASLRSAAAPPGSIDPVSKLTAKCTQTTDELLNLLEYVRDYKGGKSTIRATYRAIRKGKQIKQLYDSLKKDQDTLNQMITEKLLPSINLLAELQSKNFAEIGSISQMLVKEQIQQRKVREDHHAIVTGKLNTIQDSIQLQHTAADQERVRRDILQSLWFAEIDQRRNEIKEPAPHTLDWLFGSPSNPDSDSDLDSDSGSDYLGSDYLDSDYLDSDSIRDEAWSNFGQWLHEDASTYWISGKAGSGKSTLMAYIVDDERTRKGLNTWSSGHKLEVLSFFFWRAGSPLQNSVLGLLRSLLYRLCVLQPIIADRISENLSSFVGIPTWTEKSLLSTLIEALRSTKGIRLCLFIDGLDEYKGPYDDLVDCIEKLQSTGNMKACVSSRPELEFSNRFRDVKQLRLQDLNRGDIEKFVNQFLAKTSLSKHERIALADNVVQRAEGVFLWASLVTQALVKGAKAGDDEEIMYKRLRSLPRDMDQLFERMLSDVEPIYRASLSFYVQVMMMDTMHGDFTHIASIAIIATSLLRKEIHSYEEFAEECERMKTQIITRSAGLFEVRNIKRTHAVADEAVTWERSELKFVSDQPRFKLESEGPIRRRCTELDPYPTMLIYETQYMRWIHRSAFEFLCNQNCLLFESSSEEIFKRIGESYIAYIASAPSLMFPHLTSAPNSEPVTYMVFRVGALFVFITRRYNDYPQTAVILLDKLYSLCVRHSPGEFSGAPYSIWFDPEGGEYTAEMVFWSKCASFRRWSYMYSRVDNILEGTTGDPLIAHVLAVSMHTTQWRKDDVYMDSDDFAPFVDKLAKILCQHMTQQLEIGGDQQPTRSRFLVAKKMGREELHSYSNFVYATWEEPISSECMTITINLVAILRTVFMSDRMRGLQSALFCTLVDTIDLYVALNLRLDKMYILLSGKACIMADPVKQEKFSHYRGIVGRGIVGSHISAAQVDRAIRILCIPSLKRHESCDPDPELGFSRFIAIQPSTATSDELLNLIGYKIQSYKGIGLHMIPNAQQRREKVCEMLVQEIKAVEQGLDGDQQLIATTCVQAGLLSPDFDEHQDLGP